MTEPESNPTATATPPPLPNSSGRFSKAVIIRLAIYGVILLLSGGAVWLERSAWSQCNDAADYFIRRLEQQKPVYEAEVLERLGRKPDVHDEESVMAGLYQEYRWQGLLSTYYLKLTYTWDMTGYELNGVEGAVRRRWQGESDEITEPTELDLQLSEKAMEEAIRRSLRKGRGDISVAELSTIDKLDIDGTQLVDLKPLAKMSNLQVLYMNDNRMRDVSGLSPLRNLRILKMRHNSVETLSALSGMQRLEDLDAGHNRLTSLAPLGQLGALRKLDLENNQISDVNPLGRLRWITQLDLEHNRLRDVTPLGQMRNIQVLRLSKNQINNVQPLARIQSLEVLYLDENEIHDVSALAGLTRLQRLYLSNNQIKKVTALGSLKKLYELEINGNPLPQAEVDALRRALPNCRVEFSSN